MTVTIDLAIHPLETVLRTCHAFRCTAIPRRVDNGHVVVDLEQDLGNEFAAALLDQHLRTLIANETRTIRELLVAQAFCEADLLDRREVDADEHEDVRGIAE